MSEREAAWVETAAHRCPNCFEVAIDDCTNCGYTGFCECGQATDFSPDPLRCEDCLR